jgi:hypothetical protein
MICGNGPMLNETRALLKKQGFRGSQGKGHPGSFLVKQAFAVQKRFYHRDQG